MRQLWKNTGFTEFETFFLLLFVSFCLFSFLIQKETKNTEQTLEYNSIAIYTVENVTISVK